MEIVVWLSLYTLARNSAMFRRFSVTLDTFISEWLTEILMQFNVSPSLMRKCLNIVNFLAGVYEPEPSGIYLATKVDH